MRLMCAHARTRVRARVPAVITSPTAGEDRVYFDGKLEVGEGRGTRRRACYMAVTPQAQLLPSLFCLIMVASGGVGGRGG